MTEISNGPNGTGEPREAPAQASAPGGGKGARTALLVFGALAALVGAYFLSFFSILMIAFSFDAPGSHFWDSGVWLRLLLLWPPASLILVAAAAIFCIFRPSLRPLWIALGAFAGTILIFLVAISFFD